MNNQQFKINKFFKILIIILTVFALLFLAYVFIGSYIGYKIPIQLKNYIFSKTESLTIGSIVTGVLVFLKLVNQVKKANDDSVERIQKSNLSTEEYVSKQTEVIIESNNNAVNQINEISLNLNKEIKTMQAQPAKIAKIETALNEIYEIQKVTFEILDLFMYKNTNDQEIKDVCGKYKQWLMLNKSKLIELFEEIKEEMPEIIETVKNVSKQIDKPLKENNKKNVRII